MKIIEIKQTRNGEVAYILDEERGRVIKVLVEDMTQGYAEDEYEDVPPARMPAQPKPRRVAVRPRPPVVDDGSEDVLPDLPQKPRPSMVPPGLAGVFKPPGSPGAAEEIRRV